MAAAKDFITRQHGAGRPFFCWWNGTRMHFRTHVKTEHSGLSGPNGNEYQRRHGRARHARRRIAQADRRPRHLPTTPSCSIRPTTARTTTPGPMPARPFPQREELELGRRLPRAGLRPLAGSVSRPTQRSTASSRTRTGCRPLPQRPGIRTIKEKLLQGVELNGRTYRTTSTATTCSTTSPARRRTRRERSSCTSTTTARSWRSVTTTGRSSSWRTGARRSRCGASRSSSCGFRCSSTCAAIHSRRAQHNSNTYNDWFLSRAFVIVPLQGLAANFLMTMKDYPPSQTPGSFNLEKVQKQIEAAARGG